MSGKELSDDRTPPSTWGRGQGEGQTGSFVLPSPSGCGTEFSQSNTHSLLASRVRSRLVRVRLLSLLNCVPLRGLPEGTGQIRTRSPMSRSRSYLRSGQTSQLVRTPPIQNPKSKTENGTKMTKSDRFWGGCSCASAFERTTTRSTLLEI